MPSATAGGANLSAYFKLDGSRTITGPSLLALAAGSFASDAFTIRGAAGQTGDLLVLEDSALADVFTVDNAGNVIVSGNITSLGIVGLTAKRGYFANTLAAAQDFTYGVLINLQTAASGAHLDVSAIYGTNTHTGSGLVSVLSGAQFYTSATGPVTNHYAVYGYGDSRGSASALYGGYIQMDHRTGAVSTSMTGLYVRANRISGTVPTLIGLDVVVTGTGTVATYGIRTTGAGALFGGNVELSSGFKLGIGVTPTTALDIVGTAAAQLRLRDVTTNTTNKQGNIQLGHYTNAEEDMALIMGESLSTVGVIRIGGGSSALNAATALYFYTAANSTTVTGTPRMTIDSAGRVGIGLSGGQASAVLDIVGTAATQFRLGSATTNSTIKNAYIQGRHYTNAEEDVAIVFNASDVGSSVLSIGGGSSALNAATSVAIYTAATNTTVTGTAWFTIDSGGDITLGDGTDFILNATTGTRIGTTTTGKLGFFGSTAIARPVLATGAGATVDNVITILQNLGLVGQT